MRNTSFFPQRRKNVINLRSTLNLLAKWILSIETINPYYSPFGLFLSRKKPRAPKCIYKWIDLSRNRLSRCTHLKPFVASCLCSNVKLRWLRSRKKDYQASYSKSREISGSKHEFPCFPICPLKQRMNFWIEGNFKVRWNSRSYGI